MIRDFSMRQTCDHLTTKLDSDGNFIVETKTTGCVKCAATGVVYDFQYAIEGTPIYLSSPQDKPREDITRLMLTKKGEHKLSPNYGLNSDTYIGRKLVSTLKTRVRDDLLSSVLFVLNNQNHPTYSPYLTSEQLIRDIQTADVLQDGPTSVIAGVGFILGSGNVQTTGVQLSRGTNG